MQSLVVLARALFVLLALVVCVFIWIADNGISNAALDWLRGVRHGDKYVHFLVYGALAFFLHIALRGHGWRLWRLHVPVAAVAVLAFGLAEEITQLALPRRQFSLMDLASNLAGVLVFTLLAQLLLWWMRRGEAATPGGEARPG